MKSLIKKTKISGKHLLLLLLGAILFSQVSETALPYLAKEYVVLFVIQLYLIGNYFVLPKLKGEQVE